MGLCLRIEIRGASKGAPLDSMSLLRKFKVAHRPVPGDVFREQCPCHEKGRISPTGLKRTTCHLRRPPLLLKSPVQRRFWRRLSTDNPSICLSVCAKPCQLD